MSENDKRRPSWTDHPASEPRPVVANGEVRLYIGGLDYALRESDRVELLSHHGLKPIKSEIARATGRPLGFGFVKVNSQDAERVIDTLSGQTFRGRILKVQYARPKNRGRKRRRERGLPISKEHGGNCDSNSA